MSDQIDVNAIADTLNSKVQLPNGIGQDAVDFVVESKYPTADDPTWYRVYKSGWVEQGGDVYVSNAIVTVTFQRTMANIYYYCGCKSITTNSYNSAASMENPTTTTIGVRSGNSCNWRWEVKGMGA